ncbi:hypothetical protein KIN34_06315 [Cellulomonas sp. DKR-3]|uniref:Uncharacterized protein n=1 Tax=Cellulomonas fulva TaxID=2835530 RepID=A0ABS5TXL4_9CELL|nr:hypothetical protein [Cellulomonas fulva]MBT0993900.1 hypothetical protein [Cellulomonas fulva]
MTAPRTYAIGLPVFVTVHDDGTVTYDIDVADAADAPAAWEPEFMFMYDEHDQPIEVTDDLADADAERIRVSLERPGWVRTPDS